MKTKGSITRIAGLSFACALLFYVLVHDQLLAGFATDPSWAKVAVEIVSALGIYILAFEAMFWFYSKYFYRIFDRRLNMDGDWYQIFIINEYGDPVNAIRHGPCKITTSFEDIQISAENYRTDGEFSSSWQLVTFSITGDKLILMYESEGIRRESYITRGTMSFRIYGSPPKRLVGNFADSTPATHSGRITLYRDKSEYETRLSATKDAAIQSDDVISLVKELE